MSEKEKGHANGVMETIGKLEAVKGSEYVQGLLDGIGIGTAQTPAPQGTGNS